MRRYDRERPHEFTLRPGGLSDGCVFAGLGRSSGGFRYHDSMDRQGPGNHGTLTGFTDPAASWGRANGRAALTFNDGSNYVSCGVLPSLNIQSFTASAWIRRNGTSSQNYPQICGNGNNGFSIGLEKSTNKVFIAKAYVAILLSSIGTIPDVTWTHVSFTVADVAGTKTIACYINGKLDNSGSVVSTFSATRAFEIGGDSATPVHSTWAGSIADAVFHDAPLSASIVQTLASPDPYYNGWLVPVVRRTYFCPIGAPATGLISSSIGSRMVRGKRSGIFSSIVRGIA